MVQCRLCGKKYGDKLLDKDGKQVLDKNGLEEVIKIQQHHIVPKYIVEKVNPNSALKNFTIPLCNQCHKDVHYSFLTHFEMGYKTGDCEKVYSLNYYLMKLFILKLHPKLWKEFHMFKRDIVHKIIQEMIDEDINVEEVTHEETGVAIPLCKKDITNEDGTSENILFEAQILKDKLDKLDKK